MKREEIHPPVERAREYNARDIVLALRASVESTSDRDELRLIDAQLGNLREQIRRKMKGRGRPG